MDERRKFPRLNLNVEIEYQKVNPPPAAEVRLSESKNISVGGVCIVALDKLNIGDVLDLKLSLPEENISAKGKVAWIEEFSVGNVGSSVVAYDTGVEFTQISESDRAKINKFVLNRTA